MHLPYLHQVFEFISHNSIIGIPLDILAHLTVGAVSAYFFLRTFKNYKACLLAILTLALVKELYDQQIMTNTLQENFKDIVITMIPPFVIIYLHQIRIDREVS